MASDEHASPPPPSPAPHQTANASDGQSTIKVLVNQVFSGMDEPTARCTDLPSHTAVAYNAHGQVLPAHVENIGALSSRLPVFVLYDGSESAFRQLQHCLAAHAPAARAVHTPWDETMRHHPALAASAQRVKQTRRNWRLSGRDLTTVRMLQLLLRSRRLQRVRIDYVWTIERDAAFVGDVCRFFAAFAASSADLLTSMTVVVGASYWAYGMRWPLPPHGARATTSSAPRGEAAAAESPQPLSIDPKALAHLRMPPYRPRGRDAEGGLVLCAHSPPFATRRLLSRRARRHCDDEMPRAHLRLDLAPACA